MSVDPEAERGWLHLLGRAEGIDSLVDSELLADDKKLARERKRTRGRVHTEHKREEDGCCVLCGDDAESLSRVPDGDVCPDCYEEVNEAMPDTCSTFGCCAEPIRDGDECERCDQFDERAFRP